MKTTCPACGAVNSLDALIGNEAARSLLVMALEQTQTGRRLIRYVALFRPAHRQLSWDRVASLIGELLDLIKAGKVEAAAETRKEGGVRGLTQTGTHASHSDFKPEKKAERSSPETARAALEKVKKSIKQPANQGA